MSRPAAYRIPIDLPAGGTQWQSWLMVDKLMAIKRERIGAKIADYRIFIEPSPAFVD